VNYKLTPANFELRWNLFGWPKRISDQLEALEAKLAGRTNDFLDEMRDEQDGFIEKLKGIQSKVDNLHTFTNIERVEQVASFVREIKKDLIKCADEARTFNNREALFDVEVSERALIKTRIVAMNRIPRKNATDGYIHY
tara:strand:+ start:874 stop:1290 length:417 start_codon:yes stop_codon:yes gene_type:complete